ncbi:MAG TPA: rhodanese-like domain-containing protein [Woeseiaceae bacterium]|nr:rhodanese-like domain-containing protein [Woeseiaceae bacterium]
MNSRTSVPGFFLATGMFLALSAGAQAEDHQAIPTVDVNAARTMVANHDDAVILDVRTAAEFEISHISGATNIDVQAESFRELVAALDPDKTYIVHCTKNPVDGRSSRALQVLDGLGFKNLYSLEGGYIAWKDAELPLTEAAN